MTGVEQLARLALFLPTLDDGGAEHVMLQLGASFAARGHSVDLVVAVPGGPIESKVPASLNRIDLGARRSTMALPALVRYLRRARPAALLATLEHANLLALWAGWLSRTGIRVVLREANVLLPREQTRGVKPHIQRALMRLFYRGAARIVAVSEAVEASVVAGLHLPPGLVRTVYNPIVGPDLGRLAAAAVDDPWFAPGEPPIVLGVGRLAPQKDFASLLRAFAQVRASRPARLVILGEGPERPALESLTRQLGIEQDVRLPGFDPNPLRMMGRAQVFVLSSIFEGLPGALIQAMACGQRVVSTDCPGGSREILEGCPPACGRLVPPRDMQALAAAISSLLDEAGRGPARVQHDVRRFTEEAATELYLDALGVRSEADRQVGTAQR